MLATPCSVQYDTRVYFEDIVMKVFVCEDLDSGDESSRYRFAGYAHAGQEVRNVVVSTSERSSYWLGIELHCDLNKERLGGMSDEEKQSFICKHLRRKDTVLCETDARHAHYLISFCSADFERNCMILKYFSQLMYYI